MLLVLIPLLVVLMLWLFGRHGRLAVIHPGTWFAAAWILAIGCYSISDYAGAVPVHNDLQLETLRTYIIFTAILFFVFSLLPQPSRNAGEAIGKKLWSPRTWIELTQPMLWCAWISFAGSLANVLLLGVGFVYSDVTRQTWLSGIPEPTARLWYPYMATYPASFVAGLLVIVCVLSRRRPTKALAASTILTFGAGYLWMVGTGSRQAFGIQMLFFFVGAALGWAKIEVQRDRGLWKKVLIAIGGAIAIGTSFVWVVNVAGVMRAREQGGKESKLNQLEYIGWGGQFFEYMGISIETFQAFGAPAQRNLSDTGPVTIAGALYDLGASWLFGWRRPDALDRNPEIALRGSGFALRNATRCIFYDMEADFGFNGELVALTILVALSQVAFMATVHRTGISLIGFAGLTILLMFWGYSHQFSLLMSSQVRWTFVPFALWDILVYVSRGRTASYLPTRKWDRA